jgi:hypothetical protein
MRHKSFDDIQCPIARSLEGIVTVTIEELRMDQGVEPHAAATASCQRAVASARKALSVDREMRWR